MPELNWNLLAQSPDVGGAVQRGFQAGVAARQQMATQNALMQRQQIELEDRRVTRQDEARKREAEAQKTQRELVVMGAKIVRQMKPTDQATWAQTRAAAAQMGLPLDGVPEQFDPNYVQQLISAANALEPEKAASEPTVAKEREYWAGLGNEYVQAFDQKQLSQPDRFVPDGQGGVTVIPGRTFQAGGGAPPPPAKVIQAPAGQLPTGWSYDEGGAPPTGAPTFP